jgi:hypothetical protein
MEGDKNMRDDEFDIQFFAEDVTLEPAPEEGTDDKDIDEGDKGVDEAGKGGEEGEEEGGERFVIGDLDLTDMSNEYADKGELSEESYATLAEHGFSKEIVDAYITGIKAQQELNKSLADNDVKQIYGRVGGEDNYAKIMAWANDALSDEEKEAYDSVVGSGNKHAIMMTLLGLRHRYVSRFGSGALRPRKSGGGGEVGNGVKGFSSQSEMVKAMADKRYGRDSEYTRQVDERTMFSEALGYNKK